MRRKIRGTVAGAVRYHVRQSLSAQIRIMMRDSLLVPSFEEPPPDAVYLRTHELVLRRVRAPIEDLVVDQFGLLVQGRAEGLCGEGNEGEDQRTGS